MRSRLRSDRCLAILFSLTLFLGCGASISGVAPILAPPVEVSPFTLDSPIPVDPGVTIGTLDNGLTYYVRANGKPENRASLRLVINAGSTVEDEHQRGLAHFLEHMAFNGTRNFAKQELVDYLETIGMRFGADVNAYTSFDETVYMLEVPTDDVEILETGFQILEDWAHLISLENEEIENERGVVIEEWRLGRGAAGRIRDRQLPVTFHGSRYAERLPIGRKEILESAAPEALRSFYRDWYRTDLMAVVAVGDFDEADIVARIERRFGHLAPPVQPRPRIDFPVPDHAETLTSIVSDAEATAIDLVVGYKRPYERIESVGDLRQQIIDGLYHGMMNARLRELTQLPDPPYQFASAGSGGLGRTKSIYQLFARVRDGGVTRGLRTLLTEAKRVEQHGLTEAELERAKTNLLRSVERAYEERDKQESGRYAGSYVRHYLEKSPQPSIEYVRDLYDALLPSIALAEINARADQWITEDNRVLLVSGPDTAEAGLPDEAGLLEIFAEVEALGVTPWIDRTRDEPLVERRPDPGSIVSEEAFPELGATLWRLSNGIEILLKPTDFKNDEILLRGYSPGGHSLVPDEDYVTATQAAAIVSEMGLGGFDRIELGKALAGKAAGVRTFIGEISEGVSGRASPKDLETLFQLLYLEFTAPRRDEDAYTSYLTTTRGQLENQTASPSFWFNKKWNDVTFGDHPRRQLFTLETVEQLDLDRALEIYEDRFADASDFLFTMVGSFELEMLRPLVETWLASLPATYRDETWTDVDAYAVPQVTEFEVRKGIEPRSTVRVVFFGFADWSPLDNHLASALAQALRIRLREILREDLGGVYGVNVYSSLSRYPKGRYNSGISFSCDPERTEELLAAAFAEIERFKQEGPSQAVVDKVQEIQRRDHETSLKLNTFWLAALHLQQVDDLPLAEILEYDRKIEAVTVDSLRDAARRYFDRERYIQGVLVSEEARPPAVRPGPA